MACRRKDTAPSGYHCNVCRRQANDFRSIPHAAFVQDILFVIARRNDEAILFLQAMHTLVIVRLLW